MSQSERMLFCYLNKVKCDFVHEPFPLINPFLEERGVKFYSLEDIAAMKMHTICGRGKKKDFFDIYAGSNYMIGNKCLNGLVKNMIHLNFSFYGKA